MPVTKRKPRRKAATKKSKNASIGWGWWAAALAGVGLLVADANPDALKGFAPRIAELIDWGDGPGEDASPSAPERRQVAARRSEPQPQTERTGTPAMPRVRSAALPEARPPSVSAPVQRSQPRTPAVSDRGRTARETPLYRQPASGAEAWTTLAAGRPVRVTAQKGEWRRVESGIFTGWIKADAMQATATQRPRLPALARAETDPGLEAPVPPGAIPEPRR